MPNNSQDNSADFPKLENGEPSVLPNVEQVQALNATQELGPLQELDPIQESGLASLDFPFKDQIPQELIDLLVVGGPVVWILCLMSVFMLSVLIYKLLQFRAIGLFSSRDIKQLKQVVQTWEHGDRSAAVKDAAKSRIDMGRIVLNALTHLNNQTLTVSALKEELVRDTAYTLNQLRSHLRSIELIASLAPLLGLLGTVIGMIGSFQAMEAAGNNVDPATLSGGIWQALLTTAVGLIVAVPAIVIHNWFEKRIGIFSQELNDQMGRIVTADSLLQEIPRMTSSNPEKVTALNHAVE